MACKMALGDCVFFCTGLTLNLVVASLCYPLIFAFCLPAGQLIGADGQGGFRFDDCV